VLPELLVTTRHYILDLGLALLRDATIDHLRGGTGRPTGDRVTMAAHQPHLLIIGTALALVCTC
jgi:hypothetical protein